MAPIEMEKCFWLAHKTGRLLQVDNNFCDLLGYTDAEMLSMSIGDIDDDFSPDAEQMRSSQFAVYRKKNDSLVKVELHTQHLESNGGQICGFVRPLSVPEASLGVSESPFSLLEMILDAQKSNVVLFNEKKEVLWVNQAVCESCSRDFAELIGKKCSDLWERCKEKNCEECVIQDAVASGEVQERKLTMIEDRRWRVTAIPIKGECNTVEKVVVVGDDITEHLTMAREIRQTHKLESLGTLAGGIAHDFNNILAGLVGYTELSLLMLPDDVDGVKENLQEMSRACGRATELVRQILTFSRQGEGKLQISELPVIAKEVLKLLRSALPTTVEVQQNIEEDVNPVLADPVQIHQIIMNLCTNASHAMEPYGGLLTVTIQPKELPEHLFKQNSDLIPGEYLELLVSDTGCGMSSDIQATIFDPYFTTKKPGQGTGLGLSVVHGIVKECGGYISVESEPDRGAQFSVCLPTVERAKAVEEMIEDGGFLRGTESILMIDDEPVVLKVTKNFLELHGYKVRTEKNSIIALEMFRRNPGAFDIVISDVTMPNLTGDRLAKEILEIVPGFPIILMTGYSDFVSEKIAVQSGVKELIMKPLVGKSFLVKLRNVLDEVKKML